MIRNRDGSPIGEAMSWVSRIMAIGLVMFLPAVAGDWADRRLGTGFVGPLGLVFGVGFGITWLFRLNVGRSR